MLAGLEVLRSLDDHGIQTRKPLEIAVWTNEEGARFTPAMLGSAVFTGSLALDQALATTDGAGISVAEALRSTGYNGERPLGGAVDAYFEAHIEQGPILEDNAKSIGVVTGGQAIRWLDVRVEGVAAHAGTTPMPLRKDALYGAANMIQALENLAADFAPEGLTTVGELSISKSSRNTIPGLLTFTVDLRHHRDADIEAMEQPVQALLLPRGQVQALQPVQLVRQSTGRRSVLRELSALGTMSASISHELNQPLAAIRSYAENAGILLDHVGCRLRPGQDAVPIAKTAQARVGQARHLQRA